MVTRGAGASPPRIPVPVGDVGRGGISAMAFDGLAVGHQRIEGAVQAHRPHRCEVHAQEFAQGAAFAQPAPGGALGAGPGHACDDRAEGGGAETPAGEQPRGDALGVRFQRRGTIGGQGQLTGEELADALAQRRPIAGGDVEVSSQVEQGALSHLRAAALGAHEAEGEGLAVAAGAPDEHGATVAGCGVRCKT